MVVTIKEHRYDVDFDDVRVIAAADDGKRAIVEAHASLPPVTDAGYGKRLIDFLDVVKEAIDGVVGDGVSAECFGAAYNWRDILTGWLAIVEASKWPPACAPGMTYLLTDALPHTVDVGGVSYEVTTDFRLFVAFERDAFCDRWDAAAAYLTLEWFYPDGIPADVPAALDAFVAFYRGGLFDPVDAAGNPNRPTNGRKCIPYAFDTDDRRIYAAFHRRYGIDLAAVDLHWYTFRALLGGLYEPDFETVVGYRAMDTSRMDGAQEREYRRLQTAYELHKPGDCAAGGVIDWDAWAADKMRRLSGGE